jgi:phosphatidylinositol alpha 1,6-mannosyltransferase
MRVALVTESFAPDVNGVANSVRRVAEYLVERGHQPLVIAPQVRRSLRNVPTDPRIPVVRVPAVAMPGYTNVRLSIPSERIRRALVDFQPDVVHLASPFVLGAWAGRAAADLGLPIVAVYQTDIPGYAGGYGLGALSGGCWRWIADIHGRAVVNLAPSTATAEELQQHGVRDLRRWGRGVDVELYNPRRRDEKLRQSLLGDRTLLVGYVGRLAREKRVDLLARAAGLPGVRLVIVGDGPARRRLQRALPDATFTGTRKGIDLAALYASMDVFVHTGPFETFCQTIQEAQASGVPVVAPASGGPLDLVQPGVTGLLVQPGDASGFADAVRVLAGDAHLRRAIGRAARSAVRDRTWSALGDELYAHYLTATGAAGTAAGTAAGIVVPQQPLPALELVG